MRSRRIVVAGLVTALVAGALLIIGGAVVPGAWLIALTAGFGVFWVSGGIATRYQRRAIDAMRPLGQRNRMRLVRNAHLDIDLKRIEDLRPPADMAETHETLIAILREIVDAYSADQTAVNILHFAAQAVMRREYICNTKQLDEPGFPSYVGTLKRELMSFEGKIETLAEGQRRNIEKTINDLRKLDAPARFADSHRQLIICLQRMDRAYGEQRSCLSAKDQRGIDRTAGLLATSQRELTMVVRHIRRWPWPSTSACFGAGRTG